MVRLLLGIVLLRVGFSCRFQGLQLSFYAFHSPTRASICTASPEAHLCMVAYKVSASKNKKIILQHTCAPLAINNCPQKEKKDFSPSKPPAPAVPQSRKVLQQRFHAVGSYE
jgi:hypothetical protein